MVVTLINNINITIRLAIFGSFFIFLHVLANLTNFLDGYKSICIFRNLTGFECPGCGLTRSLLHLTHGDIDKSFQFNFLGIPIFLLFLIFMLNPNFITNTLSYFDKKLGGQATKSKVSQLLTLIIFVLLINSYRWV